MMNEVFLLIITFAISLLCIVVWLLRRELQRLKRNHLALEESLRRTNEDLAGLCSAAVVVDQHLGENEQRLNHLIDAINECQLPEQESLEPPLVEEPVRGYDAAIEKIHDGAGVDSLVKDYGLSRDEAVLLFRLHGGKR